MRSVTNTWEWAGTMQTMKQPSERNTLNKQK